MRAGIEIAGRSEDRRRLEAIARDHNAAQKHVARAKVILATADGCGTMEIMRRSGLSKPAVWHWQGSKNLRPHGRRVQCRCDLARTCWGVLPIYLTAGPFLRMNHTVIDAEVIQTSTFRRQQVA